MNITLIRALIKIKNAYMINKEIVSLKYTKGSLPVLKLLYKYGFIQSLKINSTTLEIVIHLRFFENKRLINKITFFSRPSYHSFISFSELSLIPDRKSFVLFTTNKGLLTLSQCKKYKIGGKLLFILN